MIHHKGRHYLRISVVEQWGENGLLWCLDTKYLSAFFRVSGHGIQFIERPILIERPQFLLAGGNEIKKLAVQFAASQNDLARIIRKPAVGENGSPIPPF